MNRNIILPSLYHATEKKTIIRGENRNGVGHSITADEVGRSLQRGGNRNCKVFFFCIWYDLQSFM